MQSFADSQVIWGQPFVLSVGMGPVRESPIVIAFFIRSCVLLGDITVE